jgi:hypothetical protein
MESILLCLFFVNQLILLFLLVKVFKITSSDSSGRENRDLRNISSKVIKITTNKLIIPENFDSKNIISTTPKKSKENQSRLIPVEADELLQGSMESISREMKSDIEEFNRAGLKMKPSKIERDPISALCSSSGTRHDNSAIEDKLKASFPELGSDKNLLNNISGLKTILSGDPNQIKGKIVKLISIWNDSQTSQKDKDKNDNDAPKDIKENTENDGNPEEDLNYEEFEEDPRNDADLYDNDDGSEGDTHSVIYQGQSIKLSPQTTETERSPRVRGETEGNSEKIHPCTGSEETNLTEPSNNSQSISLVINPFSVIVE